MVGWDRVRDVLCTNIVHYVEDCTLDDSNKKSSWKILSKSLTDGYRYRFFRGNFIEIIICRRLIFLLEKQYNSHAKYVSIIVSAWTLASHTVWFFFEKITVRYHTLQNMLESPWKHVKCSILFANCNLFIFRPIIAAGLVERRMAKDVKTLAAGGQLLQI